MRKFTPEAAASVVELQQVLFDYCSELDSGAQNVTDYFTEDCVFEIDSNSWHGHKGLRQHYDDYWASVRAEQPGGTRTSRHIVANMRMSFETPARATINLIFLNFSAAGAAPLFDAASPTVVSDTRIECRRDADGWRFFGFYAKPIFLGSDAFLTKALLGR